MAKKVLKFGGTSVGSIERIMNAANIIKKEHAKKNKIIVVVSAMAGKTNELLSHSKSISEQFNKKELDSFFVPLIFPGMETYINDNMDLWNEKNISLKKSIINQFSEEKSKWIKIGKLNIPSKKLLTQEGHFISTGKMWELEHDIYKSKEEYDIFAIYSDKEDLYKIYNNPEHLDLDEKFRTDVSGDILPKNNPLNFEKILYGLFFKSKN